MAKKPVKYPKKLRVKMEKVREAREERDVHANPDRSDILKILLFEVIPDRSDQLKDIDLQDGLHIGLQETYRLHELERPRLVIAPAPWLSVPASK